MGPPIAIGRSEFGADELRAQAGRMRDGAMVCRIPAIAAVLDGQSREAEATARGMAGKPA